MTGKEFAGVLRTIRDVYRGEMLPQLIAERIGPEITNRLKRCEEGSGGYATFAMLVREAQDLLEDDIRAALDLVLEAYGPDARVIKDITAQKN